MRVGCLQFAPVFGAPAENLGRIEKLLEGADADLVVLPELATTGYLFADRDEAFDLAEPVPDGPSLRALTDLCRSEGLTLCLGIAERDEDRLFNTSVVLGPEGLLLHYRKVHLFIDEFDVFEPGDRGFPVAELPGAGVRVGSMVCFDWVFPESARCLALAGADLILHPSNLVLPFCQDAMVTRSLENGVFCALANRTGTEARAGKGPLRFTGRSRVISPRGEVLAELGEEEEGLAVAELDPTRARDKRVTPRNSLLTDRRPDQYGLLQGGTAK